MNDRNSDILSLSLPSSLCKYNMELSELFNKMLAADELCLSEPEDYKIDVYVTDRVYSKFNIRKLLSSSSFSTFLTLVRREEHVSCDKPHVHRFSDFDLRFQFIKQVMCKEVFLLALAFLKKKGFLSSADEFGGMLYTIWFSHYKRLSNELKPVCSFDKVFRPGLLKDGLVNNWVSHYLLEESGELCKVTKSKDPVIYKDRVFFVSTAQERSGLEGTQSSSRFLVGTSPELEILMYTVVSMIYGNQPQKIMVEGEVLLEVAVDVELGDISSAAIR